jgi:hypothetical protein
MLLNQVSPLAALGSLLRTNSTAVLTLAGALAGALSGCGPERDWRTVAMPDTELVGQLPCRPGRFEREIVVADVRLKMFMLSCEATGVTYGIASADVVDPAHVEPVLAALIDAARSGIRGTGEVASWDVSGATPFRGNAIARLHGLRPDGVRVDEAIHVFARGTRVFEATAIGTNLSEAATKPFEEGLRFLVPDSPP